MSETPSSNIVDAETCAILHALERCIGQLVNVIDLLPDESFVLEDVHGGSSIGRHFRHVIEYMQMLGEQAPHGIVDYELRKRVELLERDRPAARVAVKGNGSRLLEALGHLGAHHALIQFLTPFVGADKIQMITSLGRECMHVIEHTTHHLALVRVLAAHCGVEIPRNVALAVATQEYEQGISFRFNYANV
jgi:uncharacterized damage-inducible protein DinB